MADRHKYRLVDWYRFKNDIESKRGKFHGWTAEMQAVIEDSDGQLQICIVDPGQIIKFASGWLDL